MKLLIFDASNYMFRAYFASVRRLADGTMVPIATTKAGEPTNAMFFFTNMVLATVNQVKPDVVAFAYDCRRTESFRFTELLPTYKAQRPPLPDAFCQQIPVCREIVDAMGYRSYAADTFEADDIIATLTRQAHEAGCQVVIASPDKDLWQLIHEDGSVVLVCDSASAKQKTMKWIMYADVLERFRVPPEKVADVLALSGDTSDNIPGCKGIGEVTAGKLIAEFGDLETLMSRLSEIKKPAQLKNLTEFAPQAALSKKLVSLRYDVPVTLALSDRPRDDERLRAIFVRYELRKLLRDVLGESERLEEEAARMAATADPLMVEPARAPAARTIPEAVLRPTLEAPKLAWPMLKTEVCQTVESLDSFFRSAKKTGLVGVWPIWAEATPYSLAGLALATRETAVYVHGKSIQASLFESMDHASSVLVGALDRLLNLNVRKVVFGVKPFVKWYLYKGRAFDIALWQDVEIQAYLVHPEQAPLDFASVVRMYLGYDLVETPETWLGTGKKRCLPESQTSSLAASCAGQWAQLVLQLALCLDRELEAHDLRRVYETLDLPLAPILARMEYEGVRLDLDALRALSTDYGERLKSIESKAASYVGSDFNINSPKQVAEFLYKKLGLVPARKKKTSSGVYSTDEETLESLSEEHPLPRLILDYRALAKLKSTYADALLSQVDSTDQRIHGRFNACVTATTRLSSSDPNLQNIPSRDEEGRKIKRAFVARPGWSFVGADYSQIELRLMAAFSGEKVLCDAYCANEDVHKKTAAAVFDIDVDAVTKSQRQVGKTINFALLYGMGAQKLARETGYSTKEAKVFLDKFKAQFPTLTAWFAKTLDAARQSGETRTLFGHRRVMPELFSTQPVVQAAGERIAQNAPVQGGASDVVKMAMIRLDRAMAENGLQAKLLIQVHDELLVECPDDEVPRVSALLREAMEGAAALAVPLVVALKVGKSWADMA